MMSLTCRDVEKFGGHQSTRRTAAIASLPASGEAAILSYRYNAPAQLMRERGTLI